MTDIATIGFLLGQDLWRAFQEMMLPHDEQTTTAPIALQGGIVFSAILLKWATLQCASQDGAAIRTTYLQAIEEAITTMEVTFGEPPDEENIP